MRQPMSETLLAGIIGISSDAVICADSAQRITFFNEGASRIFGYENSEVIGQPLEILLPRRSRSAHGEHLARFSRSQVQARRMGERQQIAGLRKNGDEFPAEAAIAHIGAGADAVFSVVLRDITERRRAEHRQQLLVDTGARLAEFLQAAELRAVVAQLWVPTMAVAAFVDMDGGGCALCLHSKDAGTRTLDIEPDSRPEHDALTRRLSVPRMEAFDEREIAGFDADARTAILSLAPRLVVSLPLVAREHRLGTVTLFRHAPLERADLLLAEQIADRAAMAIENTRLHDHLQRAVRTRDETMNVVSHDLRNPVNAVKMLAGAILRLQGELAVPPVVVEHVDVIRRAADQMDALIQDLLDASRAETGRLGVSPEPTAASALLSSALETLAPLAVDREVALADAIPPELPCVIADRERVQQVLSNLVGNAIKFTPRGGAVTVDARVDGRFVEVVVTDSGPGIPAVHLPRIFERYWQSTRINGGAGLGLPIARGIIEAHGGRIWAEDGRASGAAFHFTLPIDAS